MVGEGLDENEPRRRFRLVDDVEDPAPHRRLVHLLRLCEHATTEPVGHEVALPHPDPDDSRRVPPLVTVENDGCTWRDGSEPGRVAEEELMGHATLTSP